MVSMAILFRREDVSEGSVPDLVVDCPESDIREDVARCYPCDYCREIRGVNVECAYGSGIYPWLEYLVKMCFGHRDWRTTSRNRGRRAP